MGISTVGLAISAGCHFVLITINGLAEIHRKFVTFKVSEYGLLDPFVQFVPPTVRAIEAIASEGPVGVGIIP